MARKPSYYGQRVSQAKAIQLKCMDCCGGSRKELAECPAIWCPLWPWRMSEKKEELTEEQKKKVLKHWEKQLEFNLES